MRKLYLLLALVVFEIPVQSTAQPLRIDLSGGIHVGTDLLRISVPDYDPGFAYVAAGAIINGRVSYLIKYVGISPVINLCYRFPGIAIDPSDVNSVVLTSHGFMLDAGIEKAFRISYSTLSAGIGMGYNWDSYEAQESHQPKITFTNDGVNYWGGLSLYSPFVKGVNLTLGYRLVYKKQVIMEQQVSDWSYRLEPTRFRHLFTAGVSFELMKKKQNK